MRAYDVIRKKRDGQRLDRGEIEGFLHAYVAGDIPDYQVSALLMAIFFRGLQPDELAVWTDVMLHSGEVLDLSCVDGIKVDKHSTGGVGDKVSLTLAPLVAACGVPVPMISGRGLEHTGGTLDKLESISGFRVDLSTRQFVEQVRTIGLSLVGQTENIVPVDKKLYALRDVTCTVDSIPLIASSIMSKKLAEGIDALVLDVKVGAGAFMKTLDQARGLAQTMIGIGASMGKNVRALLTNMDQPLGRAIGNSLEAIEAIEALRGQGPADFRELVHSLAAEMLVLGEAAETEQQARQRLERAIADGSALDKMRACVEAQSGDPRALDDTSMFDLTPDCEPLPAPTAGVVTAMDTRSIGIATMVLGAGRRTMSDVIDPGVGLTVDKKIADRVEAGEPLLTIHHRQGRGLDEAKQLLLSAYTIGDTPPAFSPLIHELLTANGQGRRKLS